MSSNTIDLIGLPLSPVDSTGADKVLPVEDGSIVSADSGREMILLEQIEDDPDISQASLAAQLGVAVGTVNWHLKRLISKGYVKVKRLQRRKLRYIITPAGISYRARLTVHYIETSLRLYRRTREQVRELLGEVRQAGYSSVRLVVMPVEPGVGGAQSASDIADICRLTCLEDGIQVVMETATEPPCRSLPALEVRGMKVSLVAADKSPAESKFPAENEFPMEADKR